MDNVIENKIEQVEVPNIIDHNDNVVEEEAMDISCHDLNVDVRRH